MKLSLYNYFLPKCLIAQKPKQPRDHSRLLIFNRQTNKVSHNYFYNLSRYLKPSDVLVFNNSKVIPARVFGHKESGGRAEVLLLKPLSDDSWEGLLKARNAKNGLKLRFKQHLQAAATKFTAKTWQIKFNLTGKKLAAALQTIGAPPLPPYIKSSAPKSVLKRQYQTVFAKFDGSVAAPTAGLHFTNRLLKKIKKISCQIEFITLHVGADTFAPITEENIEKHKMHGERFRIAAATMRRLIQAKRRGRRIIAVGTTTVRVLETVFQHKPWSKQPVKTETQIFIYPGYKFKFIDALITNFHLPRSTLLLLISALLGRKKTLAIYQQAIKKKYRFYSFGDAMFII